MYLDMRKYLSAGCSTRKLVIIVQYCIPARLESHPHLAKVLPMHRNDTGRPAATAGRPVICTKLKLWTPALEIESIQDEHADAGLRIIDEPRLDLVWRLIGIDDIQVRHVVFLNLLILHSKHHGRPISAYLHAR